MEILIFRTVKTSDQLKENLVRRWLNSTLPLADFAQGKQIDPEVFARWVARYRKAASAPASPAKNRREDPVVLLKLDRKSLLSSSENPGSRMKRNRVTPALEASQIPPVR